jgi:hypothetical protein
VFGPKPAIDIIEVAPEMLWVRRAEKGPESDLEDPARFWQIGFGERANDRHITLLAI